MSTYIHLFLTITLMLSILTPITSAQTFSSIFPDIDPDTNYEYSIRYAKEKGLIKGNEQGIFEPERPISRQEFTKILIESLDSDPHLTSFQTPCFPDLISDWSYPYICYAKENQIVKGYNDGNFRPLETISFIEASKIILKTFGTSFDETSENWFTEYLETMEAKKMIPVSIRKPNKKITRSEMTELILRVKEQNGIYDSLTYDAKTNAFGFPLKQFDSCENLEAKLPQYAPMYPMPLMEASVSNKTTDMTAGNQSTEYSSTNVREKGIDEVDTIKNNGTHIFQVAENTVRIIKTDASGMLAIDAILKYANGQNSEWIHGLLISGQKLMVIGNRFITNSSDGGVLPYAKMIMPLGTSETFVDIYSLADPKNPLKIQRINIEGNYQEAREIQGKIYLVTVKPRMYWGDWTQKNTADILPTTSWGKTGSENTYTVSCTDVKYTEPVQADTFVTITSVPLETLTPSFETILGQAGTLYMTAKSLYMVSEIYPHMWYRNVLPEVDNLPQSLKSEIHRFELTSDGVVYKTKNFVPGRIINQFALDEYNQTLRVATTTGDIWGGTPKNNVYTFDISLAPLDSITGLAPNERIYSARFMGNHLYMVTFRNIDPLYSINLRDANNIFVDGELKIPGFSSYLHPIDENHLIGIGNDVEVQGDITRTKGVKISLFDISDKKNLKEITSKIIGEAGTQTPVLWDHKAFYFNPSKGIMAFPIAITAQAPSDTSFEYGKTLFRGAHIYHVSVNQGFELKANPTHYDANTQTEMHYGYDIERILSLGNFMYTVSLAEIQSHDTMNHYQTKDTKHFPLQTE